MPGQIISADEADAMTFGDGSTSSGGGFFSSIGDAFASLAKAAPGLATSFLNVKSIAQLNQLNIQRAQQGLAPLLPGDVGLDQSGPNVNVGVNAQTRGLVTYGGLALIAAGLVAVWMLTKGKK